MKDMGIVYGSKDSAKPVIIGKDVVYVHTDIKKLSKFDKVAGTFYPEYSYREIQYTKDEYLQIMVEKTQDLEKQITDLQLMMANLFEAIQENEEE